VLWCAGHTASLVSKYRPAMPILTLVIPQLKTESMKWKLEGRAVARQCQISRSLFPVLAAPSPSGQSSSFIALLFSRLLLLLRPPLLLLLLLLLLFSFFLLSAPSSSPSSSLYFSLVFSLFSLPWLSFCSLLFPFPPFWTFFGDARSCFTDLPYLLHLHCLSVEPELVSGGTCKKRRHWWA